MNSSTGVIRLRGYGTRQALVELHRYPAWAWIGRVLLFTAGWLGATLCILVFTFDPFIASFPFVIGLGMVYQAVRGRYRVSAFEGACPGCGCELRVKPGSKIHLPHPLVCYHCHHEPELLLTA